MIDAPPGYATIESRRLTTPGRSNLSLVLAVTDYSSGSNSLFAIWYYDHTANRFTDPKHLDTIQQAARQWTKRLRRERMFFGALTDRSFIDSLFPPTDPPAIFTHE